MASPRTPPPSSELELVDDAIRDVLLRLPPQEPALLVRASLVCRQWRRVVSDPAFLRLYARTHRHRTPPLLGFFVPVPGHIPRFVPAMAMAAAASSSFSLAASSSPWHWQVLDCRHGRLVLQLHTPDDDQYQLLVWDPITGDRHDLRRCPNPNDVSTSSAAAVQYVVLCAAAADFLVFCAGVVQGCTGWRAYACVYSSQLRAWGSPAELLLRLRHGGHGYDQSQPSLSLDMDPRRRGVVIGHEAYLFRFTLTLVDDDELPQTQILRYDMRRHALSVIDSPDLDGMGADAQLVATDDGLLGLASAGSGRGSSSSCRLCLWSWSRTAAAAPAPAEGAAGWVRRRVVDLRATSIRMISFANNRVINRATVVGFAEGANAILVSTDVGTFLVHLKSEQASKVCYDEIHDPVVPFMTFYYPGCACGKLPLPVETK